MTGQTGIRRQIRYMYTSRTETGMYFLHQYSKRNLKKPFITDGFFCMHIMDIKKSIDKIHTIIYSNPIELLGNRRKHL